MNKTGNRAAWWVWTLLVGIGLGSASLIGLQAIPPRPPDEMEMEVARWDAWFLYLKPIIAAIGLLGLLVLVIGLTGALDAFGARLGRRRDAE